jgi:hypothetical protein
MYIKKNSSGPRTVPWGIPEVTGAVSDATPSKFFEDQNILTDYQHGFRKKRSCESQLITIIQDLASGIDGSTQIDAILLDFSKAFVDFDVSV